MLKVFRISPEANAKVQAVLREDAFARNGYIYREGSTLGLETKDYYLYIEAPENFFKEQEEKLRIDGVKEIKGEEFEKIKGEIEKEQENVATGISLFE